MRLSQIYDIGKLICGNDAWQIDYYYPLIAWSYEEGNYIMASYKNQIGFVFWSYCNLWEAKKLVETQDYTYYESLLIKKQTSGEVAIIYLVYGKVLVQFYRLFRDLMKQEKIKYILYYKTKRKTFYLQEV